MSPGRPRPAYVADIVRRKDEALLAALAFLSALYRGDANEEGRQKTIATLRARLDPEARALADNHPEAFS